MSEFGKSCSCKCPYHMQRIEELKKENVEIRGERRFYEEERDQLRECYDIVRNDLSRMTEECDRLKVELKKQMNDERREQARLIDDRDLWKTRSNELADLVIKKEADREELAKTLASLANWNDSLRLTINDYLNERANKADLKLALTSWTNPEPQCRECGENHARD